MNTKKEPSNRTPLNQHEKSKNKTKKPFIDLAKRENYTLDRQEHRHNQRKKL